MLFFFQLKQQYVFRRGACWAGTQVASWVDVPFNYRRREVKQFEIIEQTKKRREPGAIRLAIGSFLWLLANFINDFSNVYSRRWIVLFCYFCTLAYEKQHLVPWVALFCGSLSLYANCLTKTIRQSWSIPKLQPPKSRLLLKINQYWFLMNIH